MFFDDILIVGSTDAEHDTGVRQVLPGLKQRGVWLKKDKCEFGKSDLTYLGHRVDHEGLRPTEDKFKAIRKAPEPRNVTEMKAFLGLLNYYSHFLPNLSNTLQELYELLQKEQQWRWTRKHRPHSMRQRTSYYSLDFLRTMICLDQSSSNVTIPIWNRSLLESRV